MTPRKLLKAIKDNLTEATFDPDRYTADVPHCVIGEINRLLEIEDHSEASFVVARLLFTRRDFNILNSGREHLTFRKAHRILDRAIKHASR